MVTTLKQPNHLKRREELRLKANNVFVDPEEFRTLAISNRRLTRRDDSAGCLRGLMDADTGKVYFTEEERLFGQDRS